MAHCPSCGSPNEDAARFCIKCGQSLAVRPETVGPAPVPPPRRQRRRGRTILLALLALVVVVAIAGGVYFLTQGTRGGGWIAYMTWVSVDRWSLWVTRPDGGEPTGLAREGAFASALVRIGEREGEPRPFTPTGDRMIYAVREPAGWSLYTYVLGADEADRIVSRADFTTIAYSPDGARISISAQDEDGEDNLLVVDIDGRNQVSLLDGVEGRLWSWWLPNGKQLIVMLEDQGQDSLLLTDDQGEEQFTLVDEVDVVIFIVSSKGDRIAYATRENYEWDVYVADVDGSEPTQVEGGIDRVALFGFSPDSKQLLMMATSNGDLHDLYLMETDGSDRVTLAHDLEFADGGYCPGGKRIWYMLWEGGDGSLYLADVDGKDEILVETGIGRWSMASAATGSTPIDFTPDGRTMIVNLHKGGSNWALYAVEVATGGSVELMSSAYGLGSPVVMDDRRVLFEAQDGDGQSLYIAHLDGKDTYKLVGPVDGFLGVDASPDGRRIVYSEMGSGGTRVYVIDDDGENRELLSDGALLPVWSD